MNEFKNIRFFDNLKEITVAEALNDRQIMGFYGMAKINYHSVIDDINDHDAILMINNPAVDPNNEPQIWLENVSPELKQILMEKGIWRTDSTI